MREIDRKVDSESGLVKKNYALCCQTERQRDRQTDSLLNTTTLNRILTIIISYHGNKNMIVLLVILVTCIMVITDETAYT